MGQQEIIKIMEKLDKNDWITSNEIALLSKIKPHRVSTTVKRLRGFGEVESRWTIEPWIGGKRQYEHRLTDKGRGLE